MKGLNLKRFLSILGFTLILLSFGSCSDDPFYEVRFTVIDFNTQQPVSGAQVSSGTINGSVTDLLDDIIQTQTTNADGQAFFSFEHQANLKFVFTDPATSNTGVTNVKLREDETINKTVYLYP